MSSAAYTAKDITVLEGLEPVRKRPSMYIGGVDGKGLHHLVWEIVDNAVDEYLNGYADAITVELHKNADPGTIIYFEPDDQIFKTTQFDPHLIKAHLEDMSYIHSGLSITFKNHITKETLDLTHAGGIPEFLGRLVTEGQKAAVTESPFLLAR